MSDPFPFDAALYNDLETNVSASFYANEPAQFGLASAGLLILGSIAISLRRIADSQQREPATPIPAATPVGKAPSASPSHTVLIRQPEVLRRTGLSRATMYELINAGRFPKPLKVGARINGWPEAEIDAWIATRINDRRGQ